MRTSVRAMIQRFANCKLHGHETPIRARAQSSSPFFYRINHKGIINMRIQIQYKGAKKIHRNLKRTRSGLVVHVQLKPNGRK